jgi:hypothetical protein
MKRRLHIGNISPSRGLSLRSNAASYPPPGAFISKVEVLPHLRTLNLARKEALRSGDNQKVLESTRLFLEAAKSLDNLDFSSLDRDERTEAVRFKSDRDRLRASLEVLLTFEQKNPSHGLVLHAPFEVPARFSGFGRSFTRFNWELEELRSDPSVPSEIKMALEVWSDSLNKIIASDASDIGGLKNSKQYIGSLKFLDYYEKMIGEFLKCSRRGDFSGMLKIAEARGINLPKLLYKRGVYLKLSNPTAAPNPHPSKKL